MSIDATDHLILSVLADGQWHSGEEIAQSLHLSRAALAKRINKFAKGDRGFCLERRHGRGYRLAGGLDLLQSATGEAKKPLQSIPHLQILREVGSSSDWLSENAEYSGVVVEHQNQGRGRRGRAWQAPYGKNLLLSLRFRFDHWPDGLSALGLVIGLGIVRYLNANGIPAGIKWPNDIWLNNAKLGGVLIETRGEASSACELIVGCGVNVHMQNENSADAPKPEYAWTSLKEAGFAVSRAQFAADIIQCIQSCVRDFLTRGASPALQDFAKWDVFSDQALVVSDGETRHQGRSVGVSSSGALRLRLDDGSADDGSVREFWVGDVSIRPSEQLSAKQNERP